MTGLRILLQKEWREHVRNYKVLWIPLVFIIFGIIEPLANRYMPEIMERVGKMPPGTEFPWPEFAGKDIFVSLIGQYQMIGLLVIVLGFMGAISAERKSGTAALLYVRPLSFVQYFMSKWIVVNIIVLGSVWAGFLASWYYIRILFDPVPSEDMFAMLATYSLWLVFVVSIVLVLSASLSSGAAATLGILFTIIGSVIDSVIGGFWMITPWKLPTYATFLLSDGIDLSDFWGTVGLTVILIVLLVVIGIYMAKQNAAKTTV